jgi:hypothetical protein
MSTYRHTCRCGAKGPSFDSKRESRDWLASHHRREGCAGRSAARARLDDAELAELRARARRCRPIPVAPSPGSWQWKDSLRSDPWGAPPSGNQLLRKAWSNGQCLQACVASLLGADVSKVPDPTISYDAEPDWHAHFNARLEKATGYRLDFLPASTFPPKDANRLWIAGFEEEEGGGHAVLARGHFIIHDPAGLYRGNVPMDRLVDGMLVVAARRIVPVFSLHGRGYAVVPA